MENLSENTLLNTKELLLRKIELKKKRLQRLHDRKNKIYTTYPKWNQALENTPLRCKIDEQKLDFPSKFLNVQVKNLEKNDTDVYTATMVFDFLEYKLEVKVDRENTSTCIKDISSKLHGMEQCFINELEPCLSFCMEKKNFQLLMWSTSIYNKKCKQRSSLIKHLHKKKYITIKTEFLFENGGLLLFIHKSSSKKVFCKCQWYLNFSLRSFGITHSFNFENAEEDNFIQQNEELLENFNISENFLDLKENFKNLISVIENIEE